MIIAFSDAAEPIQSLASVPLYLLIAAVLLALNAFFVLAEFAIVKIRPTRIEEMIDQGKSNANLLKHIQSNLDAYLSVCQLGITFASVGLGFVGEPAFARLLKPLLGSGPSAHAVAVTLAVIIASFLHVLFGEMVPKSIGIRRADTSALLSSRPLHFFNILFWLPLIVLNSSVNAVLRLFGIRPSEGESRHSEDELRILLASSQSHGMMSFRRLLLIENVFDLGDLTVKDAMKTRHGAKVLRAGASWEENLSVLRESRFSRYPLIGSDNDDTRPVGMIHVKDLLYEGPEKMAQVNLEEILRPVMTAHETASLESLLARLQRSRGHMVLVLNETGEWTGFITLEDIIEEIIGTIEDEFEEEPPLFIADALNEQRILLDVKAASMEEAIKDMITRVPEGALPLQKETVIEAVIARERKFPTYLGNGLALPHARLAGLRQSIILFARAPEGISVKGRKDPIQLLFMVLTPSASPRLQARLMARIAGLMDSEFVEERLLEETSPARVLEAIRTGDPVALS